MTYLLLFNPRETRRLIKTGQNKKIQAKGKMDNDEPLITKFGLDRHDRSGKATLCIYLGYNAKEVKVFFI